METIQLRGGPQDGKSFGWRGGDWYYCVGSMLPAPTYAAAAEDASTYEVEHHVYRRSDEDPTVFEYQPNRK